MQDQWRHESGGLNGRPPEKYRCTAVRKNGRRCWKWGTKQSGYRLCAHHGGTIARDVVQVSHLPMFYKKKLNKTLTDMVADSLDGDPREALNLYEELALVRVLAAETVGLYSAASESGKMEAMQAAGALMAEALGQVKTMCEAASRVETTGKDKFSVHTLKSIIHQIVRIAHKVLKEHPELALQFEQLVRNEIKMPNENEGTSITPDADVLEMDGTVPAA